MEILTGLNLKKSDGPKEKMKVKKSTQSPSLAQKYSGMSLTDFEKAGVILKVRSRVLGEVVYFVSNRKALEKSPGVSGQIYFPGELRSLVRSGIKKDELKKIHEGKKAFGGQILN